MSTKYIVVTTYWQPGTFPNKDLRAAINVKMKDLYDRKLAVSGLVMNDPTKYPNGSKLDLTTHTQANSADGFDTYTVEDLTYGPATMNLTHTFDAATGTVHTSIDPTVEVKELRLFVNEPAAREYMDHVLSLGCLSAMILTEEQFSPVVTLPDDSIIDQYIKP